MASEELVQRGYIVAGALVGDAYGPFERLNLGSTSMVALRRAGLLFTPPTTVDFPFKRLRPPAVGRAKPDQVFGRREAPGLLPVAAAENKRPAEVDTPNKLEKAMEQALFSAAVLDAAIAIVTTGAQYWYLDVKASMVARQLVLIDDPRDLNPSVLHNLLERDTELAKDPTLLAESVWQMIWVATQEEPKNCLLTFVEIFMLKFLSDNLPERLLPRSKRFETLIQDDRAFVANHGKLQINYYVDNIRPAIHGLFPPGAKTSDADIAGLFGLEADDPALTSPTSIIDGFAFKATTPEALATHNATFMEILSAFEAFGPLTTIEPEFKLRLYETFLRRSARQQRLGQFFTPRNIVRAMIKMARLDKLAAGSTVLDPAAGVGGFILEPLLFADALAGNITFRNGKAQRKIRTVGLDVDPDLHILAKANMLIHLAEQVRRPATTTTALNTAMADTFMVMDENQTLGALFNPPRGSVDVILTNPPYVTRGSRTYRDAVRRVNGARNGVALAEYYDRGGLGLEALFMRYISGALREGGRAYVIVPKSLLNRSAKRWKEYLLKECNLIASIELPRRAFFNTPQPTSILVLERRRTEDDERPDVFCAIARSIGESLDQRRQPTPSENDLWDIAERFVVREEAGEAETDPLIKMMPSAEFTAERRWDVARFWSDAELVALGVRTPPVSRADFVDEAVETIGEIANELRAAKEELESYGTGDFVQVRVADPDIFVVGRGIRLTNSTLESAATGSLPVYSCFTRPETVKAMVDEAWCISEGVPITEEPVVTVAATGASAVGTVFVRRERCVLNDDLNWIRPKRPDIDLEYLAAALRSVIVDGDFQYEAKLYTSRFKELEIPIPVDADGNFDVEAQKRIGEAARRVDELQQQLTDLGVWAKGARLTT